MSVHYSDDPEKNPATQLGKKWYDTEVGKHYGGASSLDWRREMEIDFSAGSGELVFPEFSDLEDVLTCEPFEIDDSYNLFGGFDWGIRNPTSFNVYAESREQRFFTVWEFYETGYTVKQVAEAIRACPFYDRIQWIAADPSIWTENQSRKDSITSIATMMQDEEEVGSKNVVECLMPAHDRSDISAINQMKLMWQTTPPRHMIFRTCPNQISELKNLKYPERTERTNETEKILDKNNHAWDNLKYFILSHPTAKVTEEKPKYGTYGYINAITSMAQGIANQTGNSVQQEFNRLYGVQL